MKSVSQPALIEALGARLAGHKGLDGKIRVPGVHLVPPAGDLPAGLLLKMLAGLEPLSLGAIRWNGIDVWQMNDDEMSARRLRYPFVPRHGGLLPHLSLMDNATLPQIYHTRESRDKIEHSLGEHFTRLEIGAWSGRLPHEVPVHVRRRAALARALSSTPSVMFLEDPFEGDADLAAVLSALRTSMDMTLLVTGVIPPHLVLDGTLEWSDHP